MKGIDGLKEFINECTDFIKQIDVNYTYCEEKAILNIIAGDKKRDNYVKVKERNVRYNKHFKGKQKIKLICINASLSRNLHSNFKEYVIPKTYHIWSKSDEEYLKRHIYHKSLVELAKDLNRTEQSVRAKIIKDNIKTDTSWFRKRDNNITVNSLRYILGVSHDYLSRILSLFDYTQDKAYIRKCSQREPKRYKYFSMEDIGRFIIDYAFLIPYRDIDIDTYISAYFESDYGGHFIIHGILNKLFKRLPTIRKVLDLPCEYCGDYVKYSYYNRNCNCGKRITTDYIMETLNGC